MENKMNNNNNFGSDIIITILYYIKRSNLPYTITLTPYEYYYDLTKREIKERFKDCVERYLDIRDYIKDHNKKEITLLVNTVKNNALEIIDRATYFYFDNKTLVYRVKMDFEQHIIDSVAICSEDTVETYDISRIEMNEILYTSRLYARQDTDDVISRYSKAIYFKE